MPKRSAGLLLYRQGDAGMEVLLVHPGGPFWHGKDDAAWSVPKGEHPEEEDPAVAAEREFAEELGSPAPSGPRLDLGEVRQSSGKRVRVWAVAADFDSTGFVSNLAQAEWPPRSGQHVTFPEVDQAAWFTLDVARRKLVKAQAAFVDRLLEVVEAAV